MNHILNLDQDLKDFLVHFGEVTSAKVIMDKFTGKSKDFGFVDMPDNTGAKKAIAESDNGTLMEYQ